MADPTDISIQMAHGIDAEKMLDQFPRVMNDHSVRCFTRKDAMLFIRHAYQLGALDGLTHSANGEVAG